MSLNIKDRETCELARELARETGETMTKAMKLALRQRLEQVKRNKSRATAEELMEIGRRCAKRLRGKPVDHDELLYDEYGLPK